MVLEDSEGEVLAAEERVEDGKQLIYLDGDYVFSLNATTYEFAAVQIYLFFCLYCIHNKFYFVPLHRQSSS